jgi:hypothetical protein
LAADAAFGAIDDVSLRFGGISGGFLVLE